MSACQHIRYACRSNSFCVKCWPEGMAIRCGLNCPGIESRLGARFSTSAVTGTGAHQAAYSWHRMILGAQAPGAWR